MCLLSVIEDCDLRADSLPITFMYLACVLDAYARRCVSRHLLRLCRLLRLSTPCSDVGFSCDAAIIVVEAAQDRDGDHAPSARTLSLRSC